ITRRTPDILDPTFPIGADVSENNREGLNGRIFLGATNPGLAFWPRTDITDKGVFSFDVRIDKATVKMPLMFVNNIAATNELSMKATADHY
ncbi:hypothetical protein SB724_20120, partial [Bacillus sp. SIMBA_031]